MRSLRSAAALSLRPSLAQKQLHVFAFVRQRSAPIEDIIERVLGSPWAWFKVTAVEVVTNVRGSGRMLSPEESPVGSAKAEEGLSGRFSAASADELLICR